MTRLFTEGFEMGDLLSLDDIIDGGGSARSYTASTTVKRTGSYSFGLSLKGSIGGWGYIYGIKYFSATDEIYIRLGVYIGSDYDNRNRPTIALAYDTTRVMSLFYDGTNHRFNAYIGNDGLTGTTPAPTVNGGSGKVNDTTWYLLEAYFKLADSSGRLVTRIDGETDIDYTGDTKPDANTTFNRIYIGTRLYYDSIGVAYFDDIAINDRNGVADNAWCGDGHIIALTPNASGDFNDFTPSTGSAINNFQMVDETPSDSDTTYVQSDTPDHKDLYNLSASGLVDIDNQISRIWIESRGKDTTTGSGIIKLLISEDGTITESADIELTTAYGLLKSGEYLVDPVTSERWLAATLNSLQAGVKVVQ